MWTGCSSIWLASFFSFSACYHWPSAWSYAQCERDERNCYEMRPDFRVSHKKIEKVIHFFSIVYSMDYLPFSCECLCDSNSRIEFKLIGLVARRFLECLTDSLIWLSLLFFFQRKNPKNPSLWTPCIAAKFDCLNKGALDWITRFLQCEAFNSRSSNYFWNPRS